MVAPFRMAVVGAGWAGLAAAVQATRQGAQVCLFEMASSAGGRARQVPARSGRAPETQGQVMPKPGFDNGQHILIGAYTETLALMQQVGADPQHLFWRAPLTLCDAVGHGLTLPPGPAAPAFVRGVLTAKGWRWRDKASLLWWAARWRRKNFECDQAASVADLCSGLPGRLQRALIEPLCIAALNTEMQRASGQVFLRVLRDALFGGPGSADLLIPTVPLSALLPEPALRWLAQAGARYRLGHRVMALQPASKEPSTGWLVDGEAFDAVVLACSSVEAARLALPQNPAWAAQATALRHEPIVTVWLHDPKLRLSQPMVALATGTRAPAQFAFDLGQLGLAPQTLAFVVSGAGPWVDEGLTSTADAVIAQARRQFPGSFVQDQPLRHVAAERRATFACTPGLQRPAMHIAPGLLAAGDYMHGPYPATLEAAVRSGLAAARSLTGASSAVTTADRLPPEFTMSI